jgi:hypothetical protein
VHLLILGKVVRCAALTSVTIVSRAELSDANFRAGRIETSSD